jgi:hypothetical protein
MRTQAVHTSEVVTLAFLILTMGLAAARSSSAASGDTKAAPLKKVVDIPMPGPAQPLRLPKS